MAGVKLKNGLRKYLERLQDHNGKYNEADITDNVGSLGKKVVQEEYIVSGVKPTEIRADLGNKQVEIVAVGEHLAFSEYGTGIRGEGQYEGELPTQTLTFESPQGVTRQTQGWVYDYMKKLYNPEKKSFEGTQPKAQMFKASRKLRDEMSTRLKQELKGD